MVKIELAIKGGIAITPYFQSYGYLNGSILDILCVCVIPCQSRYTEMVALGLNRTVMQKITFI